MITAFMVIVNALLYQKITEVEASSVWNDVEYHMPWVAFDGNNATEWVCLNEPNSAWIEARFGKHYRVGRVVLRDRLKKEAPPSEVVLIFSDGQMLSFEYPIEYQCGKPLELTFTPVITSSLRVQITSTHQGVNPGFSEVEIYEVLNDGSYKQLTYEGPELEEQRARRKYWVEKYNETKAFLEELRAKVDLEANPRYRTTYSIDEQNNTVTIAKEPWSLTWSLATGCVVRAKIKDVEFDDAEISSLILADMDNKEYYYYQKLTTDGKFKVNDSKFQITITGSFTPQGEPRPEWSIEARRCKTSFDYKATIHKMSGLVEVRYFAKDPGLTLSQLRIMNTLGSKSADHKLSHSGAGVNVILNVANRRMGIQAHLIDWANAWFSEGVHERLLVHKELGGKQYLDVVLVNVRESPYPEIRSGEEFNYVFSLLPTRIQEMFRPIFIHSPNAQPWFATGKPFSGEDRRYIAEYSQKHDVSYFIISNWAPEFLNRVRPDDYRQLVNHIHQTGNKVIQYIDTGWNNPAKVAYYGQMNGDEIIQAMHYWRDNGTSLLSPAWRLMLLDWFRELFTEYPIEGIYLDGPNEREEGPERGHSNILGFNAFLEDLRLLVDEMTNEKFIIVHTLDQDSAPCVALGDYMLPGEQLMKSRRRDIPNFHLVYNPYLYGCNIIMYSDRSYDQARPKIVRLSLLYPLVPHFVDPPFVPSGKQFEWMKDNWVEPEEGRKAYRVYREPVFDFCQDGTAVVHHPLNSDYAEWVDVDSIDVTVICYAKPDEALVVVTAEETKDIGAFNVRINVAKLGWKNKKISLTDEVCRGLISYRDEDDWIVIPEVKLSEWPRLLRLRPQYEHRDIQ